MPKTFIIGTRGSLLARTQSTQIKNQLEELTGDKFELKIIITQGDQDTSKPLWQLDGKDFFTKELDEALLKKEIDLVVHSYKDLGSERPEGIQLAAVTKRNYSHDILLLSKKTIADLKERKIKEFNLGTSSPRRITNCKKELAAFLPYGEELLLQTKMLRGNINTRIEKLVRGEYHGIVLALAGLERLALTPESSLTLEELTKDLDYAILPHSIFPSAASQGALGIECHRDNTDICKMLEGLHHDQTGDEVFRERQAFNEYGGGCHLAVGIQVEKVNGHYLHIHRGETDNKAVSLKYIEKTKLPKAQGKLFIGLPNERREKLEGFSPSVLFDHLVEKTPLPNIELKNLPVYITSSHVIKALEGRKIKGPIWVAGTSTWKRMAELGHWVQGSSDSLGDNELDKLFNCRALSLFKDRPLKNIQVLSHDKATSTLGEVLSCYTRNNKATEQNFEDELKKVGLFYWTSFYQYESYCQRFPFVSKAHHTCGLGKTLNHFNNKNIAVIPLASIDDLKPWDLI